MLLMNGNDEMSHVVDFIRNSKFSKLHVLEFIPPLPKRNPQINVGARFVEPRGKIEHLRDPNRLWGEIGVFAKKHCLQENPVKSHFFVIKQCHTKTSHTKNLLVGGGRFVLKTFGETSFLLFCEKISGFF